MFTTSQQYLSDLNRVVHSASKLDIAVAYIGSDADEIFSQTPKPVRLVCSLLSGSTDPDTIEKLRALPNVKVKHRTDLHAKVVLGDSEAIIGSANLSDNGIGFRQEGKANLIEAGMVIRGESQLQPVRNWFEELWNNAYEIESEDLRLATDRWKRLQAAKHDAKLTRRRLIDVPMQEFKGVEIYVPIYNTGIRPHPIEEAFEESRSMIAGDPTKRNLRNALDCFWGWPKLPADGAPLLCFYYGARYGLFQDGAWQRIPDWDIEGIFAGYEGIQMALPCKNIRGMSYTAGDAKVLAKVLQPAMSQCLKRLAESPGVYYSLYKALQIAGLGPEESITNASNRRKKNNDHTTLVRDSY